MKHLSYFIQLIINKYIMDSELLNKLFIKRFCLPVNTDIDSYENGSITLSKKTNYVCGNYNHVSCVLQGRNSRILSIGINKLGDSEKYTQGTHAEHDAILKLLPLKYKKRLENIDLLVIRLSLKNKIQSSKPCYHCIEMMKILPRKKGYNIQNIYYSDNSGSIIKTTLSQLDNEEKHFTQYYRNKTIL